MVLRTPFQWCITRPKNLTLLSQNEKENFCSRFGILLYCCHGGGAEPPLAPTLPENIVMEMNNVMLQTAQQYD